MLGRFITIALFYSSCFLYWTVSFSGNSTSSCFLSMFSGCSVVFVLLVVLSVLFLSSSSVVSVFSSVSFSSVAVFLFSVESVFVFSSLVFSVLSAASVLSDFVSSSSSV